MENNNSSAVIWIAAGVGIIALLIAWAAYNRSGTDLEDQALRESQEAAQEADAEFDEAEEDARLAAARAEARADIVALRARVAAEEGYENAAAELAEIRAELAAAYENASAEAQEEWEDIKDGFSRIEDSLRTGTGNVLEFFASLALLLEADVRVDGDENNLGE